jgi:hypothetical protein
MGFTIKKVFLIDGVGAIITGLMLSQVLARFAPLFGMPANLLFILSGLAFCFALYSLSCYLLVVENPAKNLMVIIIANLFYCLGTFVLVILHFQELKWLGIFYFVGEITIVLLLVRFEYRKWKENRYDNQ